MITTRRLAILVFSIASASCGGGGGDSPAPAPPPPPPPPVVGVPTAVADTATAVWYRDVTIDVAVNDLVTVGALTVTAVGNGAHGNAVVTAGRVVYTPNVGYIGNDTLQYTLRADQGGATTNGTVTIAVKGLYSQTKCNAEV